MTDFESYAERVRAALAERRALAQAATAGPWSEEEHRRELSYRDVDGPSYGWVARTDPETGDAAFIAANDPAHVLALLDQQEAAVEVAVEGLRRHQRGRCDPDGCCECVLCTPNGRIVYKRFPCSDALAWWSVLTGIGASCGVTA
jgi:hypothetical protein